MIPRKYGPQLFSLILSGLMSLLVSGISTFHVTGTVSNLASLWSSAWLTAWFFAFPAVLLVTPLARKAVQLLIEKD
ncbi:MAG: DUF2798 domain-containing protein [Thiobacillus sp.]|nr:DUF2798 domain-containing protein [Thiobacillus sp.]